MTLRARRLLLISTVIWLFASLGLIFFGPVSLNGIETGLAERARESLIEREHDWAQVSVDGQVATLTGAAPNAPMRDDALYTVLRSTWSGGVVAGGITRVIDDTSDMRVERRFVFRADFNNGRVLIRGDASDAATRDAIAQYANSNFPAGAQTDLTLIPGSASSAEWVDAAIRLLGQLARLDRGSIVLDAEQGGLIGDAANPQIAQSVAAALLVMPGPFSSSVVVTPAGAPAAVRIETGEGCSAVLRAARGADDMRFDGGGPAPNPFSEIVLRRVGRMFSLCPDELRLMLRIDMSAGSEDLAAQRAAAVQELLVQGGSDESRIDVVLARDQMRVIGFDVSDVVNPGIEE
jgi:hypothetical protein